MKLANTCALAAIFAWTACSGDPVEEKPSVVENQDPIGVIEATPTSGVPPLSVSFDATQSTDADGQIVVYAWNFGDGASATGPMAEHTYRSIGQYEVELTVTDDDGASHQTTTTITATKGATPRAPTAAFTASAMRGAVPFSVTFDAGSSTDSDGLIVLHVWDMKDGTQGTGQIFRHTFTDVGVYDVTLKIHDDDGLTDETMMTVRVTEEGGGIPPDAVFTMSQSAGFAPLTVDFDATNSDPKEGSITSYDWTFGDNQSGSGAMVSHTYANSGVYQAQLAITNTANSIGMTTKRLVVRGTVALPFSDDYSQDLGWIVVEEGDADGPANWQLQNGTLVQTSNLGGGETTAMGINKPGTHVYYGDPSWTDYRVSVTFNTPDDDGVGVMARYVDDDNFYRFNVDNQRGYARLVVKQNGSYSVLAEDLAFGGYSPGADHTLALVVNGTNLEAYYDGTQLFTATDMTHAAGAIGLYSWYNADLSFDNLSVTAP